MREVELFAVREKFRDEGPCTKTRGPSILSVKSHVERNSPPYAKAMTNYRLWNSRSLFMNIILRLSFAILYILTSVVCCRTAHKRGRDLLHMQGRSRPST
jgi:hypothetical protein